VDAITAPVQPLKIFLVEDSLMDINLFKIALSRRNSSTQLTIFKDGEKALRHLRQNPGKASRPDLAILDLYMPGMDGMELLQAFKNDPDLESMPVIVFTSSQLPAEFSRCYENGAVKVVSKPMELEPFLGAVQGIEDCLRKNVDGHGELGACIG